MHEQCCALGILFSWSKVFKLTAQFCALYQFSNAMHSLKEYSTVSYSTLAFLVISATLVLLAFLVVYHIFYQNTTQTWNRVYCASSLKRCFGVLRVKVFYYRAHTNIPCTTAHRHLVSE